MNTKKLVNPLLSAVERAKAMIAAEKEAKAPTIMTRSGITDLANRVRQSEGQYGAQRVERAADEIPNLEKLYQDQALMRAFTGDNAQGLMTMKPSDFERYAATLGLSDRSLQNISHLTNVQTSGGFSDVPYLNINKKEQGTMGLPYIAGHEGRHRNRAMDAAGEQAGLVQLVPRSELREPFPRRSREDYLEALYKEMQLTDNRVMPEAYYLDVQRPAIDLPEFYAQGGLVDSAPEEAIKNTITDPQAFRMLDMDLANLALMSQQPQRMAEGGAVHTDKGGKASKDDIMNLKPQPKAQDTSFASVRSLLADIGRNQEEYERIAQGGAFDRRKFTPENIYAMRLLQAANQTPDPARYLESLNPYLDSQLQFELNPYTNEAGYVSKSEPNKVVIQRLEQVANTIPHELTHTLQLGKGANPNLENNTQAFARARGLPADMKSSVFPSTNVTDMTELWGNVNARAHLVNAAGGDFINSPEGKALFPTNTEQRDYYSNAMPGVNSITPDTGTFVPNNQTLLQRAKRSLGFADGGITPRAFSYSPTDRDEHNRKLGLPAEFYRAGQADPTMQSYGAGVSVPVGGARLTADAIAARNAQMRDTLAGIMLGAEFPVGEGTLRAETMRPTMQGASPTYGLRYNQRFANGGAVQRFDEGGEVSQSELDRMKFEIAQAQNPSSPVMQATPRGAIQDFIGTAGGYMDRAGKFVSEAIAPTAEKHPVKHFLADILLASPLKGAGTLMQDLTGTARETDEDDPVRGVIDKGWRKLSTGTEPLLDPRALDVAGFATPVVRGATKLGQAGVKAITPFAKSSAEMAAELYASGQMPGMVSSNAYVVAPKGNLNFRPSLTGEMFKGSETQPVSNFLNQAQGIPGMTASGIETGLGPIRALDPNQKISKSAFADQVRPSEYGKIDIRTLANDANEHLYEEALQRTNPAQAIQNIGLPRTETDSILTFMRTGDQNYLTPRAATALERLRLNNPEDLRFAIEESRREMASELFQDLVMEQKSLPPSEYPHITYQRVFPSGSPRTPYDFFDVDTIEDIPGSTSFNKPLKYEEIGIVHPSMVGKPYKHYPDGSQEGLIGHFRGTMIGDTEPPLVAGGVTLSPNSYVIEEIQSDLQKKIKGATHYVPQTGALHQVHGTVFKAAVQHALEGGAERVYLPTAVTIAEIRGTAENFLSSVYDNAVIKEGLRPLLKIPGVTSKPIKGVDDKIWYHELSFTPEAKEHILKGSGQTVPGYARGGSVKNPFTSPKHSGYNIDHMRYELSRQG